MIDILQYLLSFIVAIGILVSVHEYGHFWVARRLGVRVLRFSVGFGKPLWKRIGRDGTEYVIAALPLGGYVRMLGEEDEDVAEADLPYAFSRKPLRVKAAIVAAGPVMNLLFAVAAFWLMFMVGIPGQKPIVGKVPTASIAAQAGLERGDEILQVNGVATPSWSEVNTELLDAALSANQIPLQIRDHHGAIRDLRLEYTDRTRLLDEKGILENLGIQTWTPQAWLGEITPGSPAEQAGLRQGDRIVRVNDTAVETWDEWVEVIRANPQQQVEIELVRDGQRRVTQATPENYHDEESGETYGRIGVWYQIPDEIRAQHTTTIQYGPVDGLARAVGKTWEYSTLMVRMLGRMITGEASHKNISGPITIAQYAGVSASLGWLEFVNFLALISISLGVLNLLPIPVLDGGHLFYYVIESVRGGPLSETAQAVGQQIGIAALILLMGLAFYNDFARLFG